jgi:hypothetical protein
MESSPKNIIYQGNSIISIETLPDYPHPVIVKKPAQKHPSPHLIRSLEKEYEMIRLALSVEGALRSRLKLLIIQDNTGCPEQFAPVRRRDCLKWSNLQHLLYKRGD